MRCFVLFYIVVPNQFALPGFARMPAKCRQTSPKNKKNKLLPGRSARALMAQVYVGNLPHDILERHVEGEPQESIAKLAATRAEDDKVNLRASGRVGSEPQHAVVAAPCTRPTGAPTIDTRPCEQIFFSSLAA